MRTIIWYTLLYLFFVSVSPANYRDSGWRIFKQPNGVEFIGGEFGDEFEYTSVTKEGYIYLRNYTNGWAYYALLGSDGDYVASDKRVGIDTPPTVQWLKRTGLAKSRIDQRRKEFNSGTSQSQTCGGLREHSIGVLFIEFSGTPHYSSSSIGRPHGYTWTDYNNLLFSEGIYNTAKTGLRSPNNDEVFGSVRDYYSEMSLGNEEISGFSINPIGN